MRYLLLLFSISLLATDCSEYKIHSLFYQPLVKDLKNLNWDKKFQQMKDKKIDTLILQWTQYGQYNFLQQDKWLKNILENAQKNNIKIIIGLYADENYFNTLQDDATNIEKYLNELKNKNIKQAKQIFKISKKYNSFFGWYIYDEINDTFFRSKSKQLLLHNYLTHLASQLKNIKEKPLYLSGYFSMAMDPSDFAVMFSYITAQQYTVLLQSGVGAKLVNMRESSIYMDAFYKSYNADFIPIVESFNIVQGKAKRISQDDRCNQMKMLEKSTKQKSFSLFSMRYFLEDYLK